MKLFDTPEIAVGYAGSRPYFHPHVIGRVKSYLDLSEKINSALDVGCGAGLSTIALLDIAKHVTGVDSSEAMIRSAIRKGGIEYFNYPAEHLPFKQKFDLITLAGSINWIDRAKFFSEAERILNDAGVVIIYDNTILGIMEDDDRFEKWHHDEFSKEYPRPPRDESPISRKAAAAYGFDFVFSEDYTNDVRFGLHAFVQYLFTQTNITSVLDKHPKCADDIESRLLLSLGPFFGSDEKKIMFGGYIWYLRKM